MVVVGIGIEEVFQPLGNFVSEDVFAQLVVQAGLVISFYDAFNRAADGVFENAIERLFYSDNLRIGQAVLPRSRVRSRLHRLNYFVLQEAEIKLHANRNVPVRDSTKYVMSTIYNCITETESDLLVDPYLNSLRSPPGKGRG